jgi:hypothetical protein
MSFGLCVIGPRTIRRIQLLPQFTSKVCTAQCAKRNRSESAFAATEAGTDQRAETCSDYGADAFFGDCSVLSAGTQKTSAEQGCREIFELHDCNTPSKF